MAALGFKNRGLKITDGLYVLNHTKAKAILIEVCFVDDKDDYNLYKKVGYKKVAEAIAEGIVGHVIKGTSTTKKYQALYDMNIRMSGSINATVIGYLEKGGIISGTPAANNWLKTSKGYVRIKGEKTTYLKEI